MIDFPLELLEDEEIIEPTVYVEEAHGENDWRAIHKYGPIKSNKWYTIIETGFDWVKVKLRGNSIIVPNWVFEQ